MYLSVFSPVFGDKNFEEMLQYLNSLGIKSIELGCGGYPGTKHADASQLVDNKEKVDEIKHLLNKYDITICALSTHNNPVHPNKVIADKAKKEFINACQLAKQLEVDTVITFSGCPGDSTESKYPNWVTCSWPDDFMTILDYQWNSVLVPYWKEATEIAKLNGVSKIALEMHPGFCVYNPESLMKLRSRVGDIIGANFDPSHLIWQGIDVVDAIRYLGKAIHHFHAKDTKIDARNTAINGVLDTKHYSDEINRSWIFRTVGYGSSDSVWKDILSMLNNIGYNGAISIEHEDSLMQPYEGLEKAIDYLKCLIINHPKPTTISWA